MHNPDPLRFEGKCGIMDAFMLGKPMAFVDVETTGGSPDYSRIIEIGIVRTENGEVAETYSSLVNPGVRIPPEITRLTGIADHDLEHAPSFRSIADNVLPLLEDAVFVAHNVRFDYAFVTEELRRLGISYSAKMLCTVKLSRMLFPREHGHNLDAIISRFGIPCKSRHRALDDAMVLPEFIKCASAVVGPDRVREAAELQLRGPRLPQQIARDAIEGLPETPGVYIMYDPVGTVLYVGKSINIKSRVLSHFHGGSGTDLKLFQQTASIEGVTTTGEFSALMTESELVKSYKPTYNRKLRAAESYVWLTETETEDGYRTVKVHEGPIGPDTDPQTILGIFKSTRQMKTALKEIAKTHGLCPSILGLEKTGRACFSSQVGLCSGACTGKVKPAVYNMRFAEAFVPHRIKPWPFTGPVAIADRARTGERMAYIVRDWRVTGTVRWDAEGNENAQDDPRPFDPDTYAIIRTFLTRKRGEVGITPLEFEAGPAGS